MICNYGKVIYLINNSKSGKMSRFPRDFDNKSLYKELKQAVENDKLYWLRNEAKIRASITSKNYDEFREVVAAAHLTPLDKNDKIREGKNVWNKMKTHDID